jgi:DNA-directed RNA polymerase subunit RPC12/RpoP
MPVYCEKCSGVIPIDHTKIGMTIDCPTCGARTLLKYAMGSSIPPTGWSLSYADFAQLLSEPSYHRRIGPMLESWYDCTLERTSGKVTLRNRNGSSLSMEDTHLAIQSDAKRQYELYQVAMDLWR